MLDLGTWIEAGKFHVDWALRYDTLSAAMVAMVSFVSMLIHVYSIGYMAHDARPRYRFFAYLSLFTFAMLMLVTADNLAQLFFGWEGVGLCSYLLIGYLVRSARRQRRGDQGVHRQPHRRSAFRRGHRADLFDVRLDRVRRHLRRRARKHGADTYHLFGTQPADAGGDRLPAVHRRHGQIGAAWSCMSGCPTRWRVRRRSPP